MRKKRERVSRAAGRVLSRAPGTELQLKLQLQLYCELELQVRVEVQVELGVHFEMRNEIEKGADCQLIAELS